VRVTKIHWIRSARAKKIGHCNRGALSLV
jgi:hypothetical protein